jgi:ketosteroid isomerase-like protein
MMMPKTLLLIVLLSLATTTLAARQNPSAAEAAVRDTITRLVSAYAANDLDTYFSFFADDMTVWWNTDGRYDRPTPKSAYVKSWPEFVKKTGGHESCHTADLRIQAAPAGVAAVASYELTCVFKTAPAGGSRDETYQMTNVLFLRNGRWQVVHFNWHDRKAK